MARPRKEFDKDIFIRMCQIQCTEIEIAEVFDFNISTLKRRCHEIFKMSFEHVYKKYSAEGKTSLRRAQFKKALGGNATMLIWLGKQMLGQKDKTEIDMSGGLKLEGDKKLKETINDHFREVSRGLAEFMS